MLKITLCEPVNVELETRPTYFHTLSYYVKAYHEGDIAVIGKEVCVEEARSMNRRVPFLLL